MACRRSTPILRVPNGEPFNAAASGSSLSEVRFGALWFHAACRFPWTCYSLARFRGFNHTFTLAHHPNLPYLYVLAALFYLLSSHNHAYTFPEVVRGLAVVGLCL